MNPPAARGLELIGWLLIACGLSFAAAAVVLDPWDVDGGYYLLDSADMARGSKPFIDYPTIYPPVVQLVSSPFIALGWNRILLTIFIPLLWITANTLATGMLATRLSASRTTGVLVAALFPFFAVHNDGEHLTLELGVSLFSMLALAMLVAPSPLSRRQLAACGAFVASAAGSKQPGIVVLLPVAAILWTRRRELTRGHMGAIVAGFCSVPFAILAWLRFDLVSIYGGLLGSSFQNYAKAAPGLFHPLSQLRLLLTWYVGWTPETLLFFLLCIALTTLLLFRPGNHRLVCAAAALGAVIQFAPRMLRNFPHYDLNLWPFCVVIVAISATRLSIFATRMLRGALPLLGVMFLLHGEHFARGTSRLFNFYVPAAARLRAVTPPTATVRQYGFDPILEFLASRQLEPIDNPDAIVTGWKYPEMARAYSTPPRTDSTVVILDYENPGAQPVLADLHSRGFVEVVTSRRLVFLRHRTALVPEPQSAAR